VNVHEELTQMVAATTGLTGPSARGAAERLLEAGWRPTEAPTFERVRALPQRWHEESEDRYYARRHTSRYGIDYEAGFADGWAHAADLLRAALEVGDG
jgi:hypothetical protein